MIVAPQVALGLAIWLIGVCRAEQVLFETKSPGVLDRAVIVSAEDFDLRHMKIMAESFVAQEGPKHVLVRLTVGTSSLEVGRAFAIVRSEATYENSVEHIQANGLPTAPLARVVGFGGAAVLWIRGREGVSVWSITGGQDGIYFQENGATLELVHFKLWPNRAPAATEDGYFMTAYFKANREVSMADTAAVARQLQKALGVGSIKTNVRRDSWFLDHDDYPDVPPFQIAPRVPTRAEYYAAPTASCLLGHSLKGDLRCDGHAVLP